MKKDAAGKSRGFGFVRFADADIQRKVYTMRHAIKDRRIELKVPRQVRMVSINHKELQHIISIVMGYSLEFL